jgi:hypothetical protein
VNTVADCRLIELPQLSRPEGAISVVEGEADVIPFRIARTFYVYDVVGGAIRGGHAHRELEQFLVAVMGGFTVLLWDGTEQRDIAMNRPYFGLYVPPLIWTDLVDFTSGAVCVVLASLPYEERDYFRDRGDLVAHRQAISTQLAQ